MQEDKTNRRLAAILVADVVGYSRLMGEDEAGTLQAMRSHRFALIDPNIGAHHGRIVKLMGDGILVEFQSATDAVRCAIAIQDGMVERNAEVSEERQITFRIGVNMGEILIEDDDIFGDDVNIAARLEPLAEPNGVCVSARVFEHVDGQVDHSFTDMGAHKFKNIARPVRAYGYTPASAARPPQAAFMPFVDLPPDKPAETTGGCFCGAVRYEISEPALGSMYCQCRMCQRFTGAPVMAGTTFLTKSVHFTKGEPKFHKYTDIAERGFCAECGSSLAYRGLIGQWAEWLMIFTASLDHPENHAPTYHLGIESAMPWLELHDDLPRIRCQDSPSLIKAYASVNQKAP